MPKHTCPRPENWGRFRSLSNREFSFPFLPIGLLEAQIGSKLRTAAKFETTGCGLAFHHAFDWQSRGRLGLEVWCLARRRSAPATRSREWSVQRPSVKISTTRVARSTGSARRKPSFGRQITAWRCAPNHEGSSSPIRDHPRRSQRQSQCCFRSDSCSWQAVCSVGRAVEP